MRLLTNVLTVGLLMAFVQVFTQPLQAQGASMYSWFSSSPADGSWFAGASIQYGGDPNCDFCTPDVGLNMLVYENGVGVNYQSGSDPSGTLELDYNSPTIVGLNTPYVVTGQGGWYDEYGQEVGDYKTTDTTPGIPHVSLLQIDDTNPYSVAFTYYADSDMYSSTLQIGDQYAISSEPREPRFSGFNQTLYPGPLDPGGPNTPIVFQGSLAGHDFGGQSCYVAKETNISRSDSKNSTLHEVKEDLVVPIEVTHIGSENVNTYSYCTRPVSGDGAVQVNYAFGSINTQTNNICVFVVDCDIWSMAEINVYPIDPSTFPALAPPPGTFNSDPMTPFQDSIATIGGTSVKTFQSMQVVYPALWLPFGTGMAVCNTLLQIDGGGAAQPIGPMGCIDLTLP